MAVLTGTVPVSKMRTYTFQFTAYTRGLGHLTCALKGYEPCPDQDEIVKEMGYDPERDLDNPTGSVFCAHGAGFVVPWYQVEQYMHLETQAQETEETDPEMVPSWTPPGRGDRSDSYADEKELQAIFERTFGPVKSRLPQEYKRVVSAPSEYRPKRKNKPAGDEYLLVDGYNMIFAWEELRSLAQENIHAAQDRLKDILANYQVSIPPGGRTDALVQAVISWHYKDGILRTRGLDADQTEAAIKATFKMLNIVENDIIK